MSDYDEISFDIGDIIYDTNTPLENAWFILEGSVELSLKMGKKEIALTLGENQFIGDAGVAVAEKQQGLSYRAKATVTSPVKAVKIPVKDIQSELELCPPLLKAWFASFINRMLLLVQNLSE